MDRDDVTMYYPVMNVTQYEGQLSTYYHLNGGSMTTPQSEEKKCISGRWQAPRSTRKKIVRASPFGRCPRPEGPRAAEQASSPGQTS